MRYLLDVNALLALGIKQHQFNHRVETWIAGLSSTLQPTLATCSITELGFVRIASQVSAYGFTFAQARDELLQLKQSTVYDFKFLVDSDDISKLPTWVKTGKNTTDGHLAQLAKSQGAILATLDEKIPDSFLIPI
jgi:predicted nucleic acid-binding protein